MSLFTEKCVNPSCGKPVSKKASYCNGCGVARGGGFRPCHLCGVAVGSDSHWCHHCSTDLSKQQVGDVAGQMWQRKAGQVSIRYPLYTPEGIINNGVVCGDGTLGLLYRDEVFEDYLEPGYQAFTTTVERLRKKVADPSHVYAILINESPCALSYSESKLQTAGGFSLDVSLEVEVKVSEPRAFIERAFRDTFLITEGDLRDAFQTLVAEELVQHYTAVTLEGLLSKVHHESLRNSLTAKLSPALKACGLELTSIGGIRYSGAEYERLKDAQHKHAMTKEQRDLEEKEREQKRAQQAAANAHERAEDGKDMEQAFGFQQQALKNRDQHRKIRKDRAESKGKSAQVVLTVELIAELLSGSSFKSSFEKLEKYRESQSYYSDSSAVSKVTPAPALNPVCSSPPEKPAKSSLPFASPYAGRKKTTSATPPTAQKKEQESVKESTVSEVYEKYRSSVAVIWYRTSAGEARPLGTAWLLDSKTLVTCAHVISDIEVSAVEGIEFFASFPQPGGQDAVPYRLSKVTSHPVWSAGDALSIAPNTDFKSHDIGTLTLEEEVTSTPLEIASVSELLSMNVGEAVSYIGYPSEDIIKRGGNPTRPQPVMHRGNITRMLDWSVEASAIADAQLIEHSCPGVSGVSGSPLFNAAGRVIGVFSACNRVSSRYSSQVNPIQLNYAERINLLSDLLIV